MHWGHLYASFVLVFLLLELSFCLLWQLNFDIFGRVKTIFFTYLAKQSISNKTRASCDILLQPTTIYFFSEWILLTFFFSKPVLACLTTHLLIQHWCFMLFCECSFSSLWWCCAYGKARVRASIVNAYVLCISLVRPICIMLGFCTQMGAFLHFPHAT